ncbi:DUF4124 domain-containing protein [Lysobacter solisilvae (ex Woo and Kim 2020)]|uniref:DUF4124 domain-containing protein n=1 Tax=Agrilutibacter terrestris TaxID=2865112 RepID=A0A7H0FUB5_9GAMM|nr:DUF4124 domain-containing protein [Lysobacter terrestris]QNP39631.1 DUF4124 domain-containing protein [Lysobacter terrestris]
MLDAIRSGRRLLSSTVLSGVVLLATMGTASAQGVVIYRCTDASGALTIQNGTPCPKGSKQERRVMEAAPTPPAGYTPPLPAPAPQPVVVPRALRAPPVVPPPPAPPAAAEPAVADGDRLPPPWLYECRTYDDDRYFSDNGDPRPRCVTLTTTGLGGMIENGSNTSACEMKLDQCQRVPDGALCDGWRRRLRDAESALRYGASEDRAKAEAEVQRLTRVVQETTCGRASPGP